MDNKYGGMTVNERLYVSGNWDKFQAAAEKKDVESVIQILKDVELSEENIPPILKQLGLMQ